MNSSDVSDNSASTSSNSSAFSNSFGDVSQYQELNTIGQGAYGIVYRARDLKNDEIVAMKKVRIALTEDGVPMSILREISLLSHLEKFNHPNIVRLKDICHGPRFDTEMVLYLVFEHVDLDLNAYLEKCPPPGLSSERIKDLLWQILCGIDFLHSHRIVHRDIKPQNILVSNAGQVKMADFGLARIYDTNALLTSTVVTLWYRAPEVLLGTSYATPVDIWSAGCIFAELITKTPLFPGKNEIEQLSRIFEVLGTPSDEEWPQESPVLRANFIIRNPTGLHNSLTDIETDARDLLEKILNIDPKTRITASAALAHPYFSEYGTSPHDSSISSSSIPTTPSKSSLEKSRLSDMSDSSINLNTSQNTSSSTSDTSSCTLEKTL